ncbi:MAG: TraB/GumN family protein [Cyanobacteria bacterium P01_D01_bin.56]
MTLLQKIISSKACLTVLLPLASVVALVQPARAEDTAFLWEIESPNNTVYLLGSIHLLRPTDYPLSEAIQTAFEDAENVVFEVDLAETSSPQTATAILEAAMPDGPDEILATALDEETYDLAQATAADLGLPFIGFHRFEPWMFYVNITVAKLIQLGFDPTYGIDTYLFNSANEADKDVLALETIDEQLGFLDNLSAPIQADLVEQTLLELDTLETVVDSMVSAWKSGDVSTFEGFITEGFVDFPEVYDALLVQRNQNWIPVIESFINQSDDYLIVVGAAHLVGENNVVELLQESGYTVEQTGGN